MLEEALRLKAGGQCILVLDAQLLDFRPSSSGKASDKIEGAFIKLESNEGIHGLLDRSRK